MIREFMRAAKESGYRLLCGISIGNCANDVGHEPRRFWSNCVQRRRLHDLQGLGPSPGPESEYLYLCFQT